MIVSIKEYQSDVLPTLTKSN